MPQSTSWRPQPPSVSDPEANDADLEYLADETETDGIEQDTDGIDEESSSKQGRPKAPNWLKRAKDAYRFSTTYVDSNYRKKWEDSIRAFNNLHASDSKYNTEVFRKRSNTFRPKTRAIIRKNEAAAAAAYFSNQDLTSITATNESIKEERASAELMHALLQYRLTKTVPWFQLLMGGIQDAQVQGVCVAHNYWSFVEKYDDKGAVTAKTDCPCSELFPIENLRIDPSASWIDPIGTSPYLIHLVPMYWGDVQERMENPDAKGEAWKSLPAKVAFGRSNNPDDSTRQARMGVQQDPAQQKREISDYDIVWVHRHIHRWQGEDWQFYTLASERMLTDAKPLSDTVWHGERPYVMGRIIIETHKALPASISELTKGLQEEANDNRNQRSDNVKFVLNKGYLVKRGKNVDIASLVRNVPGRVTMVDDVEADVKEQEWNDVTASAYQEEDRIDADFNDLVGNFSPLQVNTARTPRESTQTMKMLAAPSNLLTEYALKVYTETFVQPMLRQLMQLEQHYETDHTILALAGKKAQLVQKYGVDEITDDLLNRELTLTVNVGMGATDPVTKMERFRAALVTYYGLTAKGVPPGLDLKEIWKELAGLAGYQDGARFQVEGTDPMVAKLQQQLQLMQKKLMELTIDKKNKHEANVTKLQTGRESNATKLAIAGLGHAAGREESERGRTHASQHLLAEHIMALEQGTQAAQFASEESDKARAAQAQQAQTNAA
jgi:hypothetical protein